MKIAALTALLCMGLFATTAQADLYGIDGDGDLYLVSTVDASLTFVGSTGLEAGSLEYRDSNSQLYTFTLASGSTLYSIDPSNATPTVVGTGLGIGFIFEGGLTTTDAGVVYGSNAGNSGTAGLFTVNLDTGVATDVGDLGPGSGDAVDIDGLLARSDGKLIGLERVSNSLVIIDPSTPAITSTLSVFPATVGNVGGLGMEGGIAYAINEGGALYSFDMFSGATTYIGDTGIEGWRGIEGSNVPEPASLALVSAMLTGVWLRRRRRR